MLSNFWCCIDSVPMFGKSIVVMNFLVPFRLAAGFEGRSLLSFVDDSATTSPLLHLVLPRPIQSQLLQPILVAFHIGQTPELVFRWFRSRLATSCSIVGRRIRLALDFIVVVVATFVFIIGAVFIALTNPNALLVVLITDNCW